MLVALQSVELDVPGLRARFVVDVRRDLFLLAGRKREQRWLPSHNPRIIVVLADGRRCIHAAKGFSSRSFKIGSWVLCAVIDVPADLP